MDELFVFLFGFIAILGGVTTAIYRDPFDKLISLSLMAAGIFPFIVDRGYVDVATATALIVPIGTIFTLMVCRRRSGDA